MIPGDKYVKIVEWSDEDGCFIGSCPELFYGGCHGDDAKVVFAALCELVDEVLDVYTSDAKPLPTPMTGRDLFGALQGVAYKATARDRLWENDS